MTVIAGLEVPHVHIHVIPATSEEDIRFENARAGLPAEQLDSAMIRLREALKKSWKSFVPRDLRSVNPLWLG